MFVNSSTRLKFLQAILACLPFVLYAGLAFLIEVYEASEPSGSRYILVFGLQVLKFLIYPQYCWCAQINGAQGCVVLRVILIARAHYGWYG